eukprot:353518-Pelagomonas_calceolata.AAC.2
MLKGLFKAMKSHIATYSPLEPHFAPAGQKREENEARHTIMTFASRWHSMSLARPSLGAQELLSFATQWTVTQIWVRTPFEMHWALPYMHAAFFGLHNVRIIVFDVAYLKDYRLMSNVAPEMVELHFAQEGGHGLRRQTFQQHAVTSDRQPCVVHSHATVGNQAIIVQFEGVLGDRLANG